MMTMLEQILETKSWETSRGLAECRKCRLCDQQQETVEYLFAGCKMLTKREYLTRHKKNDGIGNLMGKGI